MAASAGFFARNAGKETQNSVSAADRVERCSAFAAAIRIQHGIFGQNLGKGLHIARCHCRMKCASKSTAGFTRGRKARPASSYMNSGPRRELTAGGFAAAERVRCFGEVETEDIVQEEARPLERGKSFEQQHQRDGDVVKS